MMPKFGAYQTERVLLRSGRESFWMARDAGGRPCTLHVLEPPEVWEDQQRTAAIQEFLERVAYQKQLAEVTGAVGKVLDSGTAEQGAYAVLEPVGESLTRIISARTR